MQVLRVGFPVPDTFGASPWNFTANFRRSTRSSGQRGCCTSLAARLVTWTDWEENPLDELFKRVGSTVDGSEIRPAPPVIILLYMKFYETFYVSHGIFSSYQLVSLPDFWLPSTVSIDFYHFCRVGFENLLPSFWRVQIFHSKRFFLRSWMRYSPSVLENVKNRRKLRGG